MCVYNSAQRYAPGSERMQALTRRVAHTDSPAYDVHTTIPTHITIWYSCPRDVSHAHSGLGEFVQGHTGSRKFRPPTPAIPVVPGGLNTAGNTYAAVMTGAL